MRCRNWLRAGKPLLLLRNVRYPAYQLWAIAGSNPGSQAAVSYIDVLKICVLYTLEWLRERFREHELPHEINLPPACDYEKVDISQFENVSIKMGYQLDIVACGSHK